MKRKILTGIIALTMVFASFAGEKADKKKADKVARLIDAIYVQKRTSRQILSVPWQRRNGTGLLMFRKKW